MNNNLPKTIKSLALIAFLVLVQRSALAEFAFSFNTTGSVETLSRRVAQGSSIEIPIYLVQTGSENRLSTVGMFASGVTLQYAYDSGTSGNATYSTASLASHWDGIQYIDHDSITGSVVMEGLIDDIALPAKSTNNALLLGNLTFLAGSLGNVTSLTLSFNNNNAFSNLFVDLGEFFDENAVSFGSASIETFTAVPEPSSLLLCAVATAIGVVRYRRRKRLAKESVVNDSSRNLS